jgi:hypothetical protein
MGMQGDFGGKIQQEDTSSSKNISIRAKVKKTSRTQILYPWYLDDLKKGTGFPGHINLRQYLTSCFAGHQRH